MTPQKEKPQQLTFLDMAKAKNSPTTAQQLSSLIKSAWDIMRKDKGLSGDLDRLPMLTWVMFLKFFDDMEQIRETEALLEGQTFRPALEPPYRWRDWHSYGIRAKSCHIGAKPVIARGRVRTIHSL